MSSPKLVVVGGGRMGGALVSGLVASGWKPADLAVTEVDAARRHELADAHPGLVTSADVVGAPDAVLAVKPADAEGAARAAAGAGCTRVVSVVAGLRTATLEGWCGPGVAVVRAMPNTACLVGAGTTAVTAGASAGGGDREWAAGLLGAVGDVVLVDEKLMDAVTGLSGSGPAYLFLVAEALTEGGVSAGLPRDVAARLAAGTLAGAGRLLVETGSTPEELRAAVTSPGGTTAAGLRALEARAVRSAFIEAVAAAAARSAELGA